jgi:ABC-type glycerol-3-phosphate transport system permease component
LWREAAHISTVRKQTALPALVSVFLFPFYWIWVSSLCDGADHIQDESSSLVNSLWKCPHRHAKNCMHF